MAARAICGVAAVLAPSSICKICLGRCAPRALHLISLADLFEEPFAANWDMRNFVFYENGLKLNCTMKLIFFDEVKEESEYPYYHIGGVCIDESDLNYIESKVNQLAERTFESSLLKKETEFHAAEIYHRKKNFKSWADYSKRLEVLKSLLEILSLPEACLIDIQINCRLLNEKQSPEEVAFMFLCERANDFVKQKKTLGMLIGDRENDQMSERFSTTLSGYRANRTEFAFGRELNHLVDSVHFTHSHLSRFLQLADVYSWILQFMNRNRSSQDPRHQAIFKMLKSEKIKLFPSKYKEWPKPQVL